MVEHQRLQVPPDLFLRPAGPQAAPFDEVVQCGVGRLAGQAQYRDLADILDLAQPLDHPGGPYEFDAGSGPLQRCETVDGHHMALEAQPAHSVGGPSGQGGAHCPLDDHVGVGRLGGGLRYITPVGCQDRRVPFSEHQQRGIGTGES
ncbi:hypothetical protein BN1047_01946 [Mycolicibacterium neoaurum]|uniref:Uncharacterized protein n=1 Tax=Mycolicibacterium neoaurum TaxID=1795 RepID=A0AAV2WIL5_MYCNE|nr:hypothetical protein BN1047_01946 [Mycolicibacterium neoaurum]